jgi:hypothetical protein
MSDINESLRPRVVSESLRGLVMISIIQSVSP